MTQGAAVTFTSNVPIWVGPQFVRVCLEAASALELRLKTVSVRFGAYDGPRLWAQFAWRNEVIAELTYFREGADKGVDVDIRAPSVLNQRLWVYTGEKIAKELAELLTHQVKQRLGTLLPAE